MQVHVYQQICLMLGEANETPAVGKPAIVNQTHTHNDMSLSFDGTPLKQVRDVKFLGVTLDENISWKLRINYVCKKFSKSARIIFRSRFYLSSKTQLLLYYSLIYPYLTYCNLTWSSTYVTNLNRIFLI